MDEELNKGGIGNVYNWKKDKSFWSLLIVNIISLIFLLVDNASMSTVLMVYVIQTCIICLFIYIKIIYNRRIWLGILFLLFFTPLCYACFYIINGLSDLNQISKIDYFSVLITSLLFFSNHLYSFIYNDYDIGSLNFLSFVSRIIWLGWIIAPVILLGPMSLIPFMLIKICLDQKYHADYHSEIQNWGRFD